MSDKPKKINNPVVKVVHGVEVKRYNYVNLMFNAQAFENLIEQVQETGLSIPKLIAIKSQPCQLCQCDNVTLVVKKDGRPNKQTSSQNIIERNAKGH